VTDSGDLPSVPNVQQKVEFRASFLQHALLQFSRIQIRMFQIGEKESISIQKVNEREKKINMGGQTISLGAEPGSGSQQHPDSVRQ